MYVLLVNVSSNLQSLCPISPEQHPEVGRVKDQAEVAVSPDHMFVGGLLCGAVGGCLGCVYVSHLNQRRLVGTPRLSVGSRNDHFKVILESESRTPAIP